MLVRPILVYLAAMTAAGCSGTVVMSPLSPQQIASDYASRTDTAGIIVYRAKPVVEVDQFTQISVPDPSKPGATIVTGQCLPVLTRKIATVADTEHPYRLHYDHGILETYTFGATLTADGVLTTINTQSTPDQGKTLQNLASATSSISGVVHALSGPTAQQPCTITPTFLGLEDLPKGADTKPFGSTH